MKKIVIFLIVSLLVQGCMTPRIRLIGSRNLVMEAGTPFADPGIQVNNPQQTRWVSVSNLDPRVPGLYRYKYVLIENGKPVASTWRNIQVVDTTSPTISLTGSIDTNVCPNTTYVEEGFSARDIVDGDLSSKTKVTVSMDRIEYAVSDASGNGTKVVRNLTYTDKDAPVFEGAMEITLIEGAKLPAMHAIDRCDGDRSAAIKQNTPFDSSKLGETLVEYEVSDAHGNIATFKQKVTVAKSHHATTLYFTFDDGPSALTDDFLDLLKQYNVKATFFINRRPSYAKIVKRAYDEGHTIAMHSSSHIYTSIYASEEAFYADLYYEQAWIKSVTGEISRMYRFPGGSSNEISSFNPGIMTTLTRSIREKGIQYFDWNLSSGDGSPHDSAFIVANVIRQLGSKSSYVILMHDSGTHRTTLEALREILPYCVQQGYSFAPLTYDSPSAHHGVRN